MERIQTRVQKVFFGCVLSGVFFFVFSPNLGAEVILVEPQQKVLDVRDADYAESSFGKGPAGSSEWDVQFDDTSHGADIAPSRVYGRAPASVATLGASAKPSVQTNPAANHSFVEKKQYVDLLPRNAKGVQEIALIAGDLGYFPKTLFVNQSIPVRIFVTGASDHALCIMMDAFEIRKQVRKEKIEEIEFTPKSPGQYRFYCPVNGIEGTLVVREISSL